MIPPIDLLPLPEPRSQDFPAGWFYENVAKHLIKDTVKIMNNGLPINLDRVYELELKLDSILEEVQTTINNNEYIQKFLEFKFPLVAAEIKADIESRMRSVEFYTKEFNPSKMEHRSFYMQVFLEQHAEEMFDVITPIEEILPGIPKWSVRDIKPFAEDHHEIKRLIKKTIKPTEPTAIEAMRRFAEAKLAIWNKSYYDQINEISFTSIMKPFNPASSTQKREFFNFIGIEPIEYSKDTGEASWGREAIEELQKTEEDPILLELYQAFIDHSFAAIVRNNFINAFYKYTILHPDGVHRLHGNYKLLGAKTGRYTSNNPNMLNAPSSKSIYSKPIKRCFTAPPGFVVFQIDYSALEDRVIASLTHDKNKTILQTDTELDGHLFHATIYFKQQFIDLLGDMPHRELTIAAKKALDGDNPELAKAVKKLRDTSKNVTFGASYGAFPKKIASQIKCSLEEATEIFDAYHNEMYPGITQFREEYVLPTSAANGRIHMGMGYYLYTDNADKDIRTLMNSQAQFWSIMTALSINKMHTLIDLQNYQKDIFITANIYDAIYGCVRADPIIIQWLNNNIVPVMETDFLVDQLVKNSADLEIGLDWSDAHKLSHNASIEEIENTLKKLE